LHKDMFVVVMRYIIFASGAGTANPSGAPEFTPGF
jgi:hypothetical protein